MMGLAAVAPFAAWALYAAFLGAVRVEHVAMLVVAAVLVRSGPRGKDMLRGLYPFGMVAILYDTMRPLQRVGLYPDRIHVCDLRALEAKLFGFRVGGQNFTLHDWFQQHRSRAADLVCAVPYATFLLVCVLGAIYLYVKDRPAMQRLAWSFLVVNLIGFVTYHVVPAAPPWYFHSRGCAVDLMTRPTEGAALAGVDALMGVHFFAGMYARASSVFGALPSLHCAYPLLVVIEGFRAFGPKLRVASIGFWLWMCFSAVYLDHHWVLDILLGSAYAILATSLVRACARARLRQNTMPAETPIARSQRA